MRILVTGSEGQLGQCIRDAAADSADEYIFNDVDDLDITDCEAVELSFKVNRFDVVINCAAFTDVDRAERQESIALTVNADAVGYIAKAAKDNDMTLIHISTDYVFDGKGNSPISETATPSPINAYGRTKLKGEKYILESGCNAIIIRTSWLYSEYGHNFVKTMLSLSEHKKSLSVVADQIGSPTYARDLAYAIVRMITDRSYHSKNGIYNYSNQGVCSWYDIAKMTATLAGHDECDIQPCMTKDYPSEVLRPEFSLLDKTKFKHTFDENIPYWIDSLKTCVKRLANTQND